MPERSQEARAALEAEIDGLKRSYRGLEQVLDDLAGSSTSNEPFLKVLEMRLSLVRTEIDKQLRGELVELRDARGRQNGDGL